MHDNKLKCECRMMWLAKWLLLNSHLAHETKCIYESNNQELYMIKLSESDLSCDDSDVESFTCDVEEAAICPYPCTCEKNVVDCKDKFLTESPKNIPASTVEL